MNMSFKPGGRRREKGGRQIILIEYLLYIIYFAGCSIDMTFIYYSKDQVPKTMQQGGFELLLCSSNTYLVQTSGRISPHSPSTYRGPWV